MPRKTKKSPDKILLYSIVVLVGVGLITLLSASIPYSRQDFGNIYGYFMHQLIYGFFIGAIAALIMYKFPYQKVQKLAPIFFFFSLLLMILVFIPALSAKSGVAQRWLELGSFTFQPAELIKFSFILYLGSWFSFRIKDSKNTVKIVPFSVFLVVFAVILFLQRDLSTFGIIALTAGIMYFIAGGSLRHMAFLGAMGVGAFLAFIKIAPYRMERISILLNPDKDPLGAGYQLNQALIAIGMGGLLGFGPLQGIQKMRVPLSMNDSIFAVWAEETGFIGTIFLLSLYFIIAWRGLWLAERIKNHFAKFVMAGITVWIFIQATVNIGSTIGILPLTGVTLPLVSYGSSSLVVMLAALGFMLQLSKEVD